MELVVRLFKMSVGDVCVDLRRRNVRMAKHLLDRTDIGTVLNKMRGERMPQSMRRNALKAAFFRVFADEIVDDLTVNGAAERRYEKVLNLNILFLPS